MKRHVLPHSVFPARLPLQTTAVAYLLLEHFDTPEWVYGVVGSLLAMLWLIAIVLIAAEVKKPLAGYGDAP